MTMVRQILPDGSQPPSSPLAAAHMPPLRFTPPRCLVGPLAASISDVRVTGAEGAQALAGS